MEYQHWTIKEAMQRIGAKKLYLPAIQRKFVWDAYQIERLFDSIMRDYGPATADTVSFSKEQVGIQGDIANFVVLRSFGTFNKRHPYFHGGLSLAEAVIPVLTVKLGNEASETRPLMDVQLRYRGESSGTITTRRPVLDVCVFGRELFGGEVAFRLEARTKTTTAETVVGEAASCAYVDPAN